jgi:hypothetical protein
MHQFSPVPHPVLTSLPARHPCPHLPPLPLAVRWELEGTQHHTWNAFLEAKRKELGRLNGAYKNTLKNAGVELLEGRGRIVDAHTVDVDGKRYTVCGGVGGGEDRGGGKQRNTEGAGLGKGGATEEEKEPGCVSGMQETPVG